MLFQHHKLPPAKQLVLTKNGISACYMLWLLLPKQEFILHFQWRLNSLGWQCDTGIRRWVKLTVFTYSEIYLINYFHLEMVAWDYILAIILPFGQLWATSEVIQESTSSSEIWSVLPFWLCMTYEKKKILLNRFKNLPFNSMYWKWVVYFQ